MDLELIRKNLQRVLKKSRYRHTEGVEAVSGDLALIYGYDVGKAELAGLLHDCAKYQTDEQLLEQCNKYQLPVSEIERKCPFLLHGKVGAVFAQEMYGVEDDEILSSIIFHTTGRPAMSLLEKIIFTADYIEPYRKPLPKIDEIRKAAYTDLELAIVMVLENTLNYLKESGDEIDGMTEKTYIYYKNILQTR